MFEPFLTAWGLGPDGVPIETLSSRLLPVRRGQLPAMLKIALHPEEVCGAYLMEWWDGQGAARVIEHKGPALLLERAETSPSLRNLARNGGDDEASRVICAVAAHLHRSSSKPPPQCVSLERWFQDLEPAARKYGGLLLQCSATANELLASPQEVRVLHGDLHHDNVLYFRDETWRAIDPKGLIGERGFDFANLLCNPDRETALAPGRLAHQIEVVAKAAGLERKRLLQWVLAWSGLSAVWMLQDGVSEELDLTLAELAMGELRHCSG